MKLPPGVSKAEFDAVLRNLLNSPPMPLSTISPSLKKKASILVSNRGSNAVCLARSTGVFGVYASC
jgi:hypothetical protein